MNLPISFEYSRPIEVAGQGSSIPELVVEGSDFRRSGLRAANVLCPPGRRQETPPTESFTLCRPPTTDHRLMPLESQTPEVANDVETIEVIAGVLRNGEGRVLVSRR